MHSWGVTHEVVKSVGVEREREREREREKSSQRVEEKP